MSSRAARRHRPYVDAVRDEALRRFAQENRGLRLPPVAVVIAAFDEEDGLGGVLEEIPPQVCGHEVATIVVDDGSSDATAEVARGHGVHLVRLARNCGHGVALRAGYRVARDFGARFIVTLDADGQWDPRELERVFGPLGRGEADFVIGSRVLGATETDDGVRQAGVHFFARLVSLLTGVRVTDTSSGYRAMLAEITERVPQRQVQYQTSELLIGAIYAGYRIAERPIVMRKRTAGESKKGHNALYGLRYARVILGTWWRERKRAAAQLSGKPPVRGQAPESR